MKTALNAFIVILFGLPFTAFGQVVNIPDPYFKLKVLNHDPIIDTNNDGQIQVAEAQALYGTLNLRYNNGDPGQITDITGLEAFVNIERLDAGYNAIQTMDLSSNTALKIYDASGNSYTSLDFSNNILLEFVQTNFGNLQDVDFSNNPNLTWIHIQGNQLNSIDISQNPLLEGIVLSDNPISDLDVSNNILLRYFNCRGLNLSNLDVSNNPNLLALDCQDNPTLTYINLKNGNNEGLDLSGVGASCDFHDLPSLETVCLDAMNSSLSSYIEDHVGHSVYFTEVCSLGTVNPPHQAFLLFPNPAENELCVRTLFKTNNYRIYSTSGKLINAGELREDFNTIPVEQLSSGLYFIQFITDLKEVYTYKFLKQ